MEDPPQLSIAAQFDKDAFRERYPHEVERFRDASSCHLSWLSERERNREVAHSSTQISAIYHFEVHVIAPSETSSHSDSQRRVRITKPGRAVEVNFLIKLIDCPALVAASPLVIHHA